MRRDTLSTASVAPNSLLTAMSSSAAPRMLWLTQLVKPSANKYHIGFRRRSPQVGHFCSALPIMWAWLWVDGPSDGPSEGPVNGELGTLVMGVEELALCDAEPEILPKP